MHRLLLLAGCLLLIPFVRADEDDPEPPSPDTAVRTLDRAASNAGKIGRDKVEQQRKQILARLEKMHADLVKRGKTDQARELKSRLLLAESIKPDQGLDTKLTVPKLLEKASVNGRYRELLHVLYVPNDKAGYTEFRDYGMSATPTYGGYNNLTTGYWVYVYPRWYIWKELKPGQ